MKIKSKIVSISFHARAKTISYLIKKTKNIKIIKIVTLKLINSTTKTKIKTTSLV